MKIALCCIAKNENQYFTEWVSHHLKMGFDHVIIYDNNSTPPVPKRKRYTVVKWTDTAFRSQQRAYLNACTRFAEFDYIAFLDVDEFYQSKSGNVKTDIASLGNPDAIGVYWRIYGHPTPPETRQPMKWYTHWHANNHLKSIVRPKLVLDFPDPHKAVLIQPSRYLDENGQTVTAPVGQHTSNKMWIKHIFTRSRSEFADKIKRGRADTRTHDRTWEDFENYNRLCVNVDE